MALDAATIFAFLLIFVRCSAMLLSSPVSGSPTTPLQIRIFTCMALAGAFTALLKPAIGPVPTHLFGLALAIAGEAVAGLLIGSLMSLILSAAQIAGSILDLEIGLSLSQSLNPVEGVSVTLLAQFKYMLAMVIFLSANAHHFMIQAFIHSYSSAPPLSASALPNLQNGVVSLLQSMSLLALQIAAPVMAVSVVVDAALGLISKAVPQMQAIQVGLPAKLGAGILALSLSLPPLVNGVMNGCALVNDTLLHMYQPATASK